MPFLTPCFCFFLFPPGQLRQLLSESQEQLEAAKTETQKQSQELALVREMPGAAPPACKQGSSLASGQFTKGDPRVSGLILVTQ